MTGRSARATRFAALLALVVTACSDQGPPPVGFIELVESVLSGQVDGTLSFTVRVEDESGQPIEGISVRITADQGSGSVTPSEPSTGSGGSVAVQWRLGTTAGTQSVRVSAGEKAITVQATALPGPPAALVAASGDDQTGQVGQSLAAPIVAKVGDAFENGVPDVGVQFLAESGLVSELLVFTGPEGLASTSWSLGPALGTQTVQATAASLGSVDFTANALPGPPASMTVRSGDLQAGTVGEPLGALVVFEVRDAFSNAATGATLTFSGDGTTDPQTAAVTEDALASVQWTLGTTAGAQRLIASGGSASVGASATAAPGPAARVAAASGDEQSSYATAVLSTPIVARVEDEFGNGIEGATVAFSAIVGGGSTSPSSAESGADGEAQTTWTLGGLVGTHSLQASVDGAESATFTAEAVSGPPAFVSVAAGADQTATVGQALPESIRFLISDAAQVAVPGANVAFTVISGGGSLTPPSFVTDTDGVATVDWTLGGEAGTQTMMAAVFGVSPTMVDATAEPGPPSQLVKHAGDGQRALLSGTVTVPPAVRVVDAFGNGIEGIDVTFAVESGGGSITGANQTTDVSGVAAIGSWTLGASEGLNTLEASTAGLASVTFAATAGAAGYDIEVRFVGTPPSVSQQAAFTSAAARWEQIVTGELQDLFVSYGGGLCGGIGHPPISETIDDLLIFAEVTTIDGVGGTLGRAGECLVRLSDGLTILGGMQFDEDDLDALEASGDLEAVVLHEMAHVIGIGTLEAWDDILVGEPGPDPYFPGTQAVARYTAAGGTAPNAVPIANTGGAGTAYSHWREANFGNELMTGYLNSGVANPLSAITIGALADLGYTVNLAAADAYTVSPGPFLVSPDRLIPLREIPFPPPLAIDDRGRLYRLGR